MKIKKFWFAALMLIAAVLACAEQTSVMPLSVSTPVSFATADELELRWQPQVIAGTQYEVVVLPDDQRLVNIFLRVEGAENVTQIDQRRLLFTAPENGKVMIIVFWAKIMASNYRLNFVRCLKSTFLSEWVL
jgi:hypothetical protein